MSKVLVVVYSYTGASRRVAELLRGQQGWPIADITDAVPRHGPFSGLRCVLDSLLRRRPAIRYEGPFLQDFGTVVLVAPIWARRLAGPMRSFLASRHDHLRDVALISVMGGSGAPNAVAEVGRLLGRSPLLSTAFTTAEVDDGSFATRLQAFGTALRDARKSSEVVRPVTLSPQSA